MLARAMIALAVTGGLCASAAAQSPAKWPERPVTLVVSQSAGASPDVMARLISERVSKELGHGVLVENKPGAGNVIGATAVARAAPDGYTLFFATSAALATNPYMMKNLPYDPVKDFTPVAMIARSVQAIVAANGVPAKTLAELVKLEQAKSGAYSVAVDGPRNLAGVTAQALNKRAGIKLTPVPYPNINNGVQDVLGGRVEIGVFSVSVVETHIKSGGMKALAVAGNKRVAALPDTPAAGELLPGFDYSGWFMVMAPAGTPENIVKAANAAFDAALKDPKVAGMAPRLGFEIDPAGAGSPAQAKAFLVEQVELWGRTTKDLGIEPQ